MQGLGKRLRLAIIVGREWFYLEQRRARLSFSLCPGEAVGCQVRVRQLYRYLVLSRKWHVCGLAFLRRSSSSYRMKSKERNMLDDTVVSCKLPIGTFFR